MEQTTAILYPVALPVLAGILLLCLPKMKNRKTMIIYVFAVLCITAALVIYVLLLPEAVYYIGNLTKNLPIYFKVDELGRLFAAIVTLVWVLSGVFSFTYMKHEENEKRFFGFYLIVFGILIGLDFSGNLVTMYLFYELMTLMSVPLVIHTLTKEAIRAGLKYLFYSFCGAYMALFGIYFIFRYGNTLTFTAGGVLSMDLIPGHESLLLVVAFVMILGFGIKAGMFPMHGWLSSAHPVAPAPASAVLSGIIVKSGIFAIIRTVYYIFGAEFIRDTWVQYTWIILTLITVFMGSMLAYYEKGLKKRLAYSTVSQLSYILFGLALLQPTAIVGSLLHVVFHAVIKSALFLIAGAIIYQTGKTRTDELTGIGKIMPVTMWCFTILSLALIGIPPLSGFISKWYLASGSLQSGIAVYDWLGPVVLLLSALLTAGYLLPISFKGFFPGEEYGEKKTREPVKIMLIPIVLLTTITVVLGVFPNTLISYAAKLAAKLF